MAANDDPLVRCETGGGGGVAPSRLQSLLPLVLRGSLKVLKGL